MMESSRKAWRKAFSIMRLIRTTTCAVSSPYDSSRICSRFQGVLTGLVTTIREADEKDLTLQQRAQFVADLADGLGSKLIGKTPGEALATIMDALYKITVPSRVDIERKTVESAKVNGPPEFASALEQKLSAPTANWYKAGDPAATSQQLSALVMSVPTELATKRSPAAAPTQADTDAAKKTAEAGSELVNSAANLKTGELVDKARSDLNKIARPQDIGCAFEIMSWNNARLMFGRSVANDFIAIQVTVRNLNPQEEFIVHNAMFRVDTDIHGALGQYYEGVDKVGVEAYNNAGEALTRRGLVGNSITAAGALLGVLQPIVNVTNFSNAVAAFNGGVVPGWKTLSPDHQKEQLLAIANYGFSATNNFKTVIPKSSAATFYTWFPVKPYTKGWWIQDCAQDIAGMKKTDNGNDSDKGENKPQQENQNEHRPELGVDLHRAQDFCREVPSSAWKDLSYQKWSSISDQLFRDLSLVIVAGIHVREDSKSKASITDLKCPKDAQGRLDLSKSSSNGTFGCDVSGENLDKVTKLRLGNAGNLVDAARPEGVISEASNDNSTAKVAFNTSDLNAAPGDTYNVFVVGKDGTETATSIKLYLNKTTPTLSEVNPSTIELGKSPLTLTFKGTNLDKLKNLCFKPSSGDNKSVKKPDSQSSATQMTVDVSSAGLAQGDWQIYADECPADSGSKGQSLKVNPAGANGQGSGPH
jgi:hypothetical protein